MIKYARKAAKDRAQCKDRASWAWHPLHEYSTHTRHEYGMAHTQDMNMAHTFMAHTHK